MLYLIASLCLQTPTMYNAACTNALTATAMQIGLKQTVDEMQDRAQKHITDLAEEKIGHNASVAIVAYIGYLSQNRIVVNTPIRPIADNLSVNLSPNVNEGTMTLTWSF